MGFFSPPREKHTTRILSRSPAVVAATRSRPCAVIAPQDFVAAVVDEKLEYKHFKKHAPLALDSALRLHVHTLGTLNGGC